MSAIDSAPQASPAPSPASASPPLRALVIGVDRYPAFPPDRQLFGCVNDALGMARFLVEHARVPRANLRLLLAIRPRSAGDPPEGPVDDVTRDLLAGATPAASKDVRAAFQALLDEAQPGDEVIVYYGGHGVRVSSSVTGEYVYGFAPSDVESTPAGFANLILGKELNDLARGLVAKGANPTLIADTCHSAGSVRDLGRTRERRLTPPDGGREWRLSGADWKAFVAAHPHLGATATFASAHDPSTGRPRGGSGWLAGANADWVMLAACRDIEVAGEHDWQRETAHGTVTETFGKLTGSLISELQKVPPDAVRDLRWMDLHPRVYDAVRRLGPQSPTLEGRPERPIFGGAWRPFAPGFAVDPTETAEIVGVAAGLLHGLEPGAELAIFPPDTADFDAAALAGVKPVPAVVESAQAAFATARVAPGSAVAPRSRAILTRPSPSTPRLRVLLPTDPGQSLPDEAKSALLAFKGAADLLEIVSTGPAGVEIRRWSDGRWVLAVPRSTAAALDPDDVIAYLGKPRTAAAIPPEELGRALGAGLVHWARYVLVRDRASSDPKLSALVAVTLHAGEDEDADPAKEACPPVPPGPDGVYEIRQGAPIWVEIKVQRRPLFYRLFLGVILCSDDGNVMAVWPPQGADPSAGSRGLEEWDLTLGQSIFVGEDQNVEAALPTRPDQRRSRFTYKVFAVSVPEDTAAPDLSGLPIAATVQERVDDILEGGKAGPVGQEHGLQEVAPLWCTWDLRLDVIRP